MEMKNKLTTIVLAGSMGLFGCNNAPEYENMDCPEKTASIGDVQVTYGKDVEFINEAVCYSYGVMILRYDNGIVARITLDSHGKVEGVSAIYKNKDKAQQLYDSLKVQLDKYPIDDQENR
jgi:hypothetical protein